MLGHQVELELAVGIWCILHCKHCDSRLCFQSELAHNVKVFCGAGSVATLQFNTAQYFASNAIPVFRGWSRCTVFDTWSRSTWLHPVRHWGEAPILTMLQRAHMCIYKYIHIHIHPYSFCYCICLFSSLKWSSEATSPNSPIPGSSTFSSQNLTKKLVGTSTCENKLSFSKTQVCSGMHW